MKEEAVERREELEMGGMLLGAVLGHDMAIVGMSPQHLALPG